MRSLKSIKWSTYLEALIHICYWLFHFASVNTNWEADWTDRSIRNGVAQLSIVLYPFVFYINAFWLIPRFLKGNKWSSYFFISISSVFVLELIRSMMFVAHRDELGEIETAFPAEFMSVDNLVFGLPNTLFFAFLFSIVYRFTRDWILNQGTITKLQSEKQEIYQNLKALEETLASQPLKKYKSTFQAKRRDGTFILRSDNIAYIKAQGDFVTAHDDSGNSYIINYSISMMEDFLDPSLFLRINRSEMINASFILKFSNHTKNRLEIHLRNSNEILYTSNSRTPDFRKWLESL